MPDTTAEKSLAARWTRARVLRWVGLLALALLATLAGAALTGVEHIDLLRALREPASMDGDILGSRLPRIALGALIGAALAPSGVAFQALLGNPLADPYVLGISGGAAAAGTLALVLVGGSGLSSAVVLPVAAFAGALASVGLVLLFGRVRGVLVPTVALLAGVVLNALASALIVGIRMIARPTTAHDALDWLTGSLLQPIDGTRLAALAIYVAIASLVLLRMAPAMNALVLGGEQAATLGLDVGRTRRTLFLAASVLTGGAVAMAGPIGFVGIVVPHGLRLWLGSDHRALLPASMLGGAIFLVFTDTLTRLSFLVLGVEPTVGVLTALVGAPFFLILLRHRGAEGAPL